MFPIEMIRAPTLVIHGTDDRLVPYRHALFIAEKVPVAELEAIAARKPNLHLHFIETRRQGRLTATRICTEIGDAKTDIAVSFCGPAEMRRSLLRQFKDAGLRPSRFQYEEFEIRSGLGLRRLLASLMRTRWPGIME